MLIFAVGDVVGWPGVKAVSKLLGPFCRSKGVDFTVVNGENASGLGITPQQAGELYAAGADVITLGNHTWARKEIVPYIETRTELLRPANYPPDQPGNGWKICRTPLGNIAVVSLQGRVMMEVGPENPFTAIDRILSRLEGKYDAAVVDFHAEATSEKYAMFRHLEGRAAVVFGTHTHVQTADEQVRGGTGYITDLGMTGPTDSVLGVKVDQSLAMFRGALREKFETAEGPTALCGALFTLDSGFRCTGVERVRIE